MDNFIVGFTAGLVAFPHCVGMCGGFVLHLSRIRETRSMAAGQLLWLIGKTFTYAFLGAVAGYTGGMLEQLLWNTYFPNLLSYFSGAVIFLAGLSLLGLLPLQPKAVGEGPVSKIFGEFFAAPSKGGAVLLGIMNGFLPCPVVLALLAYCMHSGSVIDGMTIMTAMGTGTMIPLLLFALLGRATGLHFRRWGARAGGVILVMLGIITTLRGTEVLHRIIGCHTEAAATDSTESPCCSGKGDGHHDGN